MGGGHISRIERGLHNPSTNTVGRLLDELGFVIRVIPQEYDIASLRERQGSVVAIDLNIPPVLQMKFEEDEDILLQTLGES